MSPLGARPCTPPEDRTSSARTAKSRGIRRTRSRSGIPQAFPSLDYSQWLGGSRPTYFRWDFSSSSRRFIARSPAVRIASSNSRSLWLWRSSGDAVFLSFGAIHISSPRSLVPAHGPFVPPVGQGYRAAFIAERSALPGAGRLGMDWSPADEVPRPS